MLDQPTTVMLLQGIRDTLLMTVLATACGYLLGLPLGIALRVTDRDGIKPMPTVYKLLDVITNVIRSVPFLILLIVVMPLTKMIVGKSYGVAATIVPLVIAAAPFIGRMVESSLREVDQGVIEAAQSMGAGNATIVWRVLLVEARTAILVGATIAIGTILGYSAMAGVVGGGGLGDIAIRYGYYRYETPIMVITVVLLVALVQIFQSAGMRISNHMDKRKF